MKTLEDLIAFKLKNNILSFESEDVFIEYLHPLVRAGYLKVLTWNDEQDPLEEDFPTYKSSNRITLKIEAFQTIVVRDMVSIHDYNDYTLSMSPDAAMIAYEGRRAGIVRSIVAKLSDDYKKGLLPRYDTSA